jgi:hypothetical protein
MTEPPHGGRRGLLSISRPERAAPLNPIGYNWVLLVMATPVYPIESLDVKINVRGFAKHAVAPVGKPVDFRTLPEGQLR